MPLIKKCTLTAWKKNVETLIDQGESESRAREIATKLLEASCLGEGLPVPRSADGSVP